MAHLLFILMGMVGTLINATAAPANEAAAVAVAASAQEVVPANDLKTDASTYERGYSDWGYPVSSGYYGATGYGIIDDRQGYGHDRQSYGYDRKSYGYDRQGYGYDGQGYAGGHYDYRYSQGAGHRGYDGYGSTGYSGYSGNGGYGGYGGNGGINSYYGYRNPYYQGANHVGFGYYKKGAYGNIYDNEVTPSLVAGYRGYTRR